MILNSRPIHLEDLPDVVRLAYESCEVAWTEPDLIHCLRTGGFGFIAEVDRQFAGYAICAPISPLLVRVIDLAVGEKFRRRRVGTRLVAAIVGTMRLARIRGVDAILREENLVGQQFLRSCAFQAIDLGYVGKFDAIHFEYRFHWLAGDTEPATAIDTKESR